MCGTTGVLTSNGMYMSVSGSQFLANIQGVTQLTPSLTGTTECSGFFSSYNFNNFNLVAFAANELCLPSAPIPTTVTPVFPPQPPPAIQPAPPPGAPPAPAPANPGTRVSTPVGHQSATTVQETQNIVVESYKPTIVVAGIAVAVTGFMALFAVVVGINNTKNTPPQPPIGSLLQAEGVTAMESNPAYTPQVNVFQNVAS